MKSYPSFHALRESTISNRFKIFLENLFCNHILQYRVRNSKCQYLKGNEVL